MDNKPQINPEHPRIKNRTSEQQQTRNDLAHDAKAIRSLKHPISHRNEHVVDEWSIFSNPTKKDIIEIMLWKNRPENLKVRSAIKAFPLPKDYSVNGFNQEFCPDYIDRLNNDDYINEIKQWNNVYWIDRMHSNDVSSFLVKLLITDVLVKNNNLVDFGGLRICKDGIESHDKNRPFEIHDTYKLSNILSFLYGPLKDLNKIKEVYDNKKDSKEFDSFNDNFLNSHFAKEFGINEDTIRNLD